jgi:hypothetical protein
MNNIALEINGYIAALVIDHDDLPNRHYALQIIAPADIARSV